MKESNTSIVTNLPNLERKLGSNLFYIAENCSKTIILFSIPSGEEETFFLIKNMINILEIITLNDKY